YNGINLVNTTYQMQILGPNNATLHSMNYGASNLQPFWTGGWQSNTVHSYPSLSYTFPALSDSATFTLKHFMNSLAGDLRTSNDTLIMFQEFKNYFAYDDGTCENGYYVMGTGGKAVYYYHLNKKDTLRAVRIHFDPAGNISLNQSYTFRIQVYTYQNGIPGTRIYNDSLKNVQYVKGGHDLFAEYELASPLILNPGDYFIGYQQFVAAGITVGFDRNYWFPGKLFYDSGNGWTASSMKGSLMMRPVFGKKPAVQTIKEYENSTPKWKIFPNPAHHYCIISSDDAAHVLHFTLRDALGNTVLEKSFNAMPARVDLSELSSGIYFYECSNDQHSLRGKLLIER
ncbi:MAG: T9SS type A sorting domain-containing protein, partial [Bacteroidia bacterium]|nr:T9SS type A sorting domain-containing protein [Bacteroidia bacterium]